MIDDTCHSTSKYSNVVYFEVLTSLCHLSCFSSKPQDVNFLLLSFSFFLAILLDHILNRLYSRLSGWLERAPLDFDYLEFAISQELVLITACSGILQVPEDIKSYLTELHDLVTTRNQPAEPRVFFERGQLGCPRFIVSEEYVSELLSMGLSVTCIARLLGLFKWTVHRWMTERGSVHTAHCLMRNWTT